MKSPSFPCGVPLLHSLQWLPVKFRVDFKISLLTFMTLHEKQPVYLHSMLATSLPSQLLRSKKRITLLLPGVKTNTGGRAFHSCAPSLLNHLLALRLATSTVFFRKCLKTHLFDLAFPQQTPALRTAHWCYGTALSILLSCHWGFLRCGCWCYRNLIDWLIDWLIDLLYIGLIFRW